MLLLVVIMMGNQVHRYSQPLHDHFDPSILNIEKVPMVPGLGSVWHSLEIIKRSLRALKFLYKCILCFALFCVAGQSTCRPTPRSGYTQCWNKWAHVMRKPVLPYANNKCADQIARLISAYFIGCLDSIIPLVSIPRISKFQLVSVAEQAGFSLTWSQTPKTGFLVRDEAQKQMTRIFF